MTPDSSSQHGHGGSEHRSDSAPAGGCRVEIRRLVADHHQLVYGYAFRLTGNRADAEDVAQQTFLQAQQNLHQLRQPENAGAWLCAIARTAWLKSCRRRRPVAAGALEMNLEDVPGHLPEKDDIDQEQLQLALDDLPNEFRLVVVMFYFQQQSYKEIAADLEIPIGTVMSRLARAKAHLRRRLAEAGQPGTAPSDSSFSSISGGT